MKTRFFLLIEVREFSVVCRLLFVAHREHFVEIVQNVKKTEIAMISLQLCAL